MFIPSIRYGLPFCGHSEEKQTLCSLISRVALVAVGGIMLLAGILALSGVSGFHALGTAGGAAFTIIGGLLVFTGLCLRSVKSNEIRIQTAQNKAVFIDPRAKNPTSTDSTRRDISGQEITEHQSYCSLESFLKSRKPDDIAVCKRLTVELGIEDLSTRIKENFSDLFVEFSLPILIQNGFRDDELLFQILKLIYLPIDDLLALQAKEVRNYHSDQQNILCLRLMDIDIKSQCRPDSMGSLFEIRDNRLTDTIPAFFYKFFTQEQVIFCIQNAKIERSLVEALFPSNDGQPFTAMRSACMLEKLPIDHVHTILPHLRGRLLWPLIKARGNELNYDLIVEDQVNEMLPCSFMEERGTQELMGSLPIEILNKLLPKMHGQQLQLIPDSHLRNSRLNLKSLPDPLICDMFPLSFMEKGNSEQRVETLHRENCAFVKKIVHFDRNDSF